MFTKLDALQKKLNSFRPLPMNTVKSLHEQFVLEWTYNSNAIEGNTLTLKETKVVLEGITIGGKSMREHFEAINHKEAIDYVEAIVANDELFTEHVIKSIHQLIRQVLVPKMEERNGEMVDTHLKVRDDFYEALTEFSNCLKVALQSATFFEDKSFSEDDRRHYKEMVKQFSSLRQLAKQDAGETIQYDEYSEQIKKLMDKHVVGVGVREPEGVYEVGKMGQQKPEEWNKDKTRNETDIIKTRITKTIEQNLLDDPYAQEAFSKLLRKAIQEAEELFDHPLKQYMIFHELEEQVQERNLPELPDSFNGNFHAQAYFGVFKKTFPEPVFASSTDEKWVELAFSVDKLVETSVAENAISPQNFEADIRQKLLPILFKECKKLGAGMDQAKSIVETVIKITRVGTAGL